MKKPKPGACSGSARTTPTIGTANAGDCDAGAAAMPQAAPAQSPVGDLDEWTAVAIVAQSIAELCALAIGIDPAARSVPVAAALKPDVGAARTPMPAQSDMAALA